MQPLKLSANLADAAMTRSSGVTSGMVIYLCLLKTVDTIFVALVSFINIILYR